MCLYFWDYMINHNEYENENEEQIRYTTQIDLGLDTNTNIVNKKPVSLRQCLYMYYMY